MLGFLCTRLQSVRGFDTSRLGQTSTHICFSSLRFFRLFSDEDCLTGLTYQRCRTLRSHYGYYSKRLRTRTLACL